MSIQPKHSPVASDEAVKKATGKTWHEWKVWIDEVNSRQQSHKAIVQLLKQEAGLESAWCQQMVANGCEKITGRRKTGETGTGIAVGTHKTIDAKLDAIWDFFLSKAGLEIWLGKGAFINKIMFLRKSRCFLFLSR